MYLLPTLRRSRCIFISSSVILNLAVLYVFGFFETDNNFEVEVFSTQQPILIQPYQSDVTLTGCGPECVVQYQVLPPDQQHTFTKWERKKNPEGYPFEIPLGTRLLPTLQSFVEPPTTLAQNKDLKYFYEDEKIHHLDSRFSGGYEDHKQKLLIIHELFKNWGKQDNNVIDARFIDTRNGHFIDITGVSEYRRFLSCKTPRYYNYEQLFPLVRTTFEGIPTWRPNQYQKVLQREYRDKPYYKVHFANSELCV
ncbi:hypothetical protein HK103_000329 [Boothiomyces macroporosus]|uniref:LicD/FKTN/FKRP nucleotidyltransferase domain-containing protein n=1 Tax=Boothiomyces macroporosus TaxID=261099 RepID=A0AAD5UFD5_9FUNG|nr:hypothetical protein HK103_000329 [Boothiomyces macroporosus]